jgi:hypothetical protein
MFSEEDGLGSSLRIAIAQDELPFADRDFVPNLPLAQYPSTTNSPATKSQPKTTLLWSANQLGK